MKTVFMSFSTDIVHGAHIAIIQKAAALGELTVGVISDEVVASYKRFPILSYCERADIFRSIKGVSAVVCQTSISGGEYISLHKPDYVVHGDDWKRDFRSTIRSEVIKLLSAYGGELIEYESISDEKYAIYEDRAMKRMLTPDIRRGRLRELLTLKPLISVIEAHSGLSGLIAENTRIHDNGKVLQFDAMWLSSLCDSTMKGKPDIELVDLTSRVQTMNDIMEVTSKPLIFDADTGGLPEHFAFTMATLERLGISAAIVEDKVGLKRNSLFGEDAGQTQDTIEGFQNKIHIGKAALKTKDTMLITRIESLILGKGQDDALSRAFAYVEAGADGVMIHSRKKEPDEIFGFCEQFRARYAHVPLVVVPSTFSQVSEDELCAYGINIAIYANQLLRASFLAMRDTAGLILKNHRALEADKMCLPIDEIIRLIPEK